MILGKNILYNVLIGALLLIVMIVSAPLFPPCTRESLDFAHEITLHTLLYVLSPLGHKLEIDLGKETVNGEGLLVRGKTLLVCDLRWKEIVIVFVP